MAAAEEFALIVLGHGSRQTQANEAIDRLAQQLGRATGARMACAAFLERALPDLASAVRELASAGARRIVIVPYFTAPGLHLAQDVPRLAADLAAAYPQVRFQVTASLDGHPGLVGLLADRVREALAEAPQQTNG